MRLKLPGILLALMLSLNAAAFDVRAVYVDHRTQVQTLPALEQLAKKAAEGGMNALVMEWEATFPFEDNATLCNRFAFSKSEVRDFINFCQRLGVDVIPLQNCFGHAEYILRHERYAGLREDAKDLSQVCPLRKEAAEKVFRSIFSEIAAAHPSRYIHIGCDETFLLGHCKKCAEYVERHGKSRLFVEYVSLMCDIVRDLGKTPVIWADILLRYPDAAGLLPSDLVVVDWNYGWRPDRFGSIDPLLEKGITMWGASALRSSPDNIYLTQWDKHFRNLREYIPFCREKGFSGIIQTSWSTSGTYGYVMDYKSVTDLVPVREVYPSQAFDILWQAFFEAVERTEPLRDDFITDYLAAHFGLAPRDAASLAGYFMQPQRSVSGKDFSRQAIDAELAGALSLRELVRSVSPRKNKSDYAHLCLMADIRIHYLRFKEVERAWETGEIGREELPVKLKPLIRESDRLRRRFVRLNKKALKDPSLPLGDNSYMGKMRRMAHY